jgi:hypothetical protein
MQKKGNSINICNFRLLLVFAGQDLSTNKEFENITGQIVGKKASSLFYSRPFLL